MTSHITYTSLGIAGSCTWSITLGLTTHNKREVCDLGISESRFSSMQTEGNESWHFMEKLSNAQQTRLTYKGGSAQTHLLAAFTRIKHNCSPAFLEHNENAI